MAFDPPVFALGLSSRYWEVGMPHCLGPGAVLAMMVKEFDDVLNVKE